MKIRELFEDHPGRKTDPRVLEWLHYVYARPDMDQLYLHGSRALFNHFKQPNIKHGHLIFMSKLAEHREYETSPVQAEYYGTNLYLLKLAPAKVFDPSYRDRDDRKILAQALPGDSWDRDNKIQNGRLDYQDLYHVVPLAVQYGYEIFRVFEVSMGKESYGVTNPALITIIERFEGV
jgi:hypothetical protein